MKNFVRLFVLAVACLAATVWASSPDDAGTIKFLKGTVEVQRGAEKIPAQEGMILKRADQIKTGSDSAVGITLRDNTVLSAGANSTLTLDKFSFDNKTQQGELQATLKRGSLSAISGAIAKTSPNAVKFNTSTMTLGVRGTEFIIEAADRGE